jgi:uncharacterized protein YuzE
VPQRGRPGSRSSAGARNTRPERRGSGPDRANPIWSSLLHSTAMIKTSHDPQADALILQVGPEGAHHESDEVAPVVILDLDARGTVVGIEVPDVRMPAPRTPTLTPTNEWIPKAPPLVGRSRGAKPPWRVSGQRPDLASLTRLPCPPSLYPPARSGLVTPAFG